VLGVAWLLGSGCASTDSLDSDQDAIFDDFDNCVNVPNGDQADTDIDGVGDACDNCRVIPNSNQQDSDNDEAGDACDVCATVFDDQADRDGDGFGDACDNCLEIPNNDQTDADNDDAGDICDCEIDDPEIGALVLSSNLGAEPLQATGGFSLANWSQAGATLLQNALVNESQDAVRANLGGLQLSDIVVEVTAASTQVQGFDAQDDRLVLVTARHQDSGGSFGASACGIRVDELANPTQRLQLLDISGSGGALSISTEADAVRNAVGANEPFLLRFHLKGTIATCTIVLPQQGNATFTATGSAALGAGGIGFITRESKASFQSLRVCEAR
jgi:hypothetical protein